MKLLIIAGPYESDRLRKAAVSAGFEAVAVEPGESLSGWITASRPALIVMAPQMVHPDPNLALAKVRSVPRGRVPIFFVGDAADEPRMSGLADGFFIRPVSPDELLERARAVLTAAAKDSAGGSGGNGARRRPRTAEGPAISSPDPATEFTQGGHTPKGGPHLARPAVLKPLKANPVVTAPKASGEQRPAGDANSLLAKLSAGIDDLFEADLSSALASAPRHAATAPEGEREFDDIPTDDRRQRPSLADRRAALLARYQVIEEGDYFQVLGLARNASADEIRRAYERIALELAPEAIDPELADELGPKLDVIREVVGEAARVLGDEQLRPRYQNHLA
ncbi:MAG TPA: DnaJ domain-containing protein [Polyangia bacterium]|nr:DnaJ domain-containing protein [Polyangia bacterium]